MNRGHCAREPLENVMLRLGPGDPPPFELINPTSQRPLLLICDHASQFVPQQLTCEGRPLGLDPSELDLHIAWDIGAAGVTRRLAAALGATAVVAGYSRLIIDLNRALGDPDVIPKVMDGIVVPANQSADLAVLQSRAEALYWPYHRAVELALARLRRLGPSPILFSVHSFTPALGLGGAPRPWLASVLTGRDERLAQVLHDGLCRGAGPIGFNEPYTGVSQGYCVKAHGLSQGLAHAQIEIRQDLIVDEDGQEAWAARLTHLLEEAGRNPNLHVQEHY